MLLEYHLPDVVALLQAATPHSPYQSNYHRHSNGHEFRLWALSHHSRLNLSADRQWDDELRECTSYLFPTATESQFRAAAWCMRLYQLIAEVFDTTNRSLDQLDVDHVLSLLDSHATGNSDCVLPRTDDRRAAVMLDLVVEEMNKTIDPLYKASIFHASAAHARAISDKERTRAAGTSSMTMDKYKEVRRDSSACRPFLEIARWVSGSQLNEPILQTDAMIGVFDAAADIVGLSNDIYSYKKERLKKEDMHNILFFIMRDSFSFDAPNGDLNAVVQCAYQMIVDAIARLQSFKFKALGAANQRGDFDETCRLIDTIMLFTCGWSKWNEIAGRYVVFSEPGDRKTRIVRFEVTECCRVELQKKVMIPTTDVQVLLIEISS